MLLDVISTIGGLVISEISSFLKDKFINKGVDEPLKILNNLSLHNPAIIPMYLEAQAKLIDANVKLFNKDIIGVPAQWLITLRGAIIPFAVAASVTMLIVDSLIWQFHIEDGIRQFFEFMISSWFGWNKKK